MSFVELKQDEDYIGRLNCCNEMKSFWDFDWQLHVATR